MSAKMQTGARHRLIGQSHMSGKLGSGIPTVEYVNHLRERVSPSTSRPYDRAFDSSTNGLVKNKSKSGKRRRRLPVKRAGTMFGNIELIPTDVTRDPPPRACFNCWQQDHSRRNCPRPSIARYCNNCGRRGEDLRSCPRCSRAHNEYLLRLQARERGEEVEPEEVLDESLLGGDGDETCDDACDEVLRELIYQDDRARKRRHSNYNQEAYKHHAVDFHDSHERRLSEQSTYRDREEDEYIKREYDTCSNNYNDRGQDEEDRGGRSDSRQQDREREDNHSYQDNELGSEYCKERENEVASVYYRDGERERDYEARARRSENRTDGKEWRKVTNTNDDVDLIGDPVQEVLQLAKSIAHLTPETQDLIMRQVMAERKERVRLRARKLQERDADAWS